MKKLFLFLFFIQFLVCSQALAQVAKIVGLKGEVTVKEEPGDLWEAANPGMLLKKEAEVKTASDSECTIAFDQELENMMVIKPNSHIKLENIQPVKLFLPEGRVFSLIDDIVKIQDFQVRTPVAVAGVRGTGESVEHKGGKTTVKCFKGKVNVQGLNNGQGTGQEEIGQGSGIEVIIEGLLQDIFGLSKEDYEEWEDFVDFIKELRAEGKSWEEISDFLEELSDEQKDDFHDGNFRDIREDQEDSGDGDGDGDGYGDLAR